MFKKHTRPMTMGFEYLQSSLELRPGEIQDLCMYPQRLFRVDRMYFETLGLTIIEVLVGNVNQSISGVPSSYYNEVDEETKMKGRPCRLDTAEPGIAIQLRLKNNNPQTVKVVGCVEGTTITYD